MPGSINVDHATAVSGVAGLSASSDISRAGSVATYLRCGGSDSFITNCLLILTVKKF